MLSGTDFDLRIGEIAGQLHREHAHGAHRQRLAPAPTLRWREGDTVTLRVANRLDEDASIHWHGILLPANMDGVPGLSFSRHPAGRDVHLSLHGEAARHLLVSQPLGFSGAARLYGPLVIEPREPEPFRYDREHVVMLTDWTDDEPERVFAKLKKQSDYYNFRQRTRRRLSSRDVRAQGWRRRSPIADVGRDADESTDLADVRATPTPI